MNASRTSIFTKKRSIFIRKEEYSHLGYIYISFTIEIIPELFTKDFTFFIKKTYMRFSLIYASTHFLTSCKSCYYRSVSFFIFVP